MLVTSEGYYAVITNNIYVNRVARLLEGNIGKYVGLGKHEMSREM
jgi:hypothetical protein